MLLYTVYGVKCKCSHCVQIFFLNNSAWSWLLHVLFSKHFRFSLSRSKEEITITCAIQYKTMAHIYSTFLIFFNPQSTFLFSFFFVFCLNGDCCIAYFNLMFPKNTGIPMSGNIWNRREVVYDTLFIFPAVRL